MWGMARVEVGVASTRKRCRWREVEGVAGTLVIEWEDVSSLLFRSEDEPNKNPESRRS